MQKLTDKVYLGDGVYIRYDGYHIVLTAENGLEATNTVYLEPEVTRAFEEYLCRLRKLGSVTKKVGE